MIEPAHEHIQHPGDDERWSDSLYFNFFSEEGKLAGLTRIGVLANANSVNAGFVALREGAPFAGMMAIDAELTSSDWDDFEVQGLRYRMIDPLRRWRIDLDAPTGRASLEFQTLAPAFDYSDCPVTLPEEVASRHYEQHCRVSGWVEPPGGARQEVAGFGQRDHSWGIRDWSGVRSWHWMQAIFGEDLAFNVFSVERHSGETATSGYVHEAGTNKAIARASLETEYDGDGRSQKAVRLQIEDTDGAEREITAERFALLPISMEGTTVNEGLFRWKLDGREGPGMYEYLFQAGADEKEQ